MGNYFLDNSDLLYTFGNLDFSGVASSPHEELPDTIGGENTSEDMDVYRSSLELCGEIAADFIAPRSASIDELGSSFSNGQVRYSGPMEEVKNCLAEAGFMGVIVPSEFGGLGFPVSVYCMMIEIISQADASVMTLFGYQDIGETIAHFADPDVARDILRSYCSGEKIGAMVLTEPGGGTDLQAVKVSATKSADGNWRLHGTKCFISHGHRDVLLVLARSDAESSGIFGLSLFLVKGGSGNGVRINRVESKMGLHGSPTCEIFFQDSIGYLIGRENLGLSLVVGILNQARFSVAAQALGVAESAYQAACDYSKDRTAFGKTLFEFPQIRSKLANIEAKQMANRALLYAGCQWLDRRNVLSHHIEQQRASGEKLDKQDSGALRMAQKYVDFLSPLSKLMITENSVRICYDSQQVFGGIGYIKGSIVERAARDIRITTIYEGTSEVLAGAAMKHVLNDALGDYIERSLSEKRRIDATNHVLDKVRALRKLFANSMRALRKNDKYYMEAISSDLVTIYGSLYIGCLLIDSLGNDTKRVDIVSRYLDLQISECTACHARIASDLYSQALHH